MSRWTRDRRPFVVGLILVGGAALLVWVYRLPPMQRNDAVGFWGFVLALVGVLIHCGSDAGIAEPIPDR